MESNHLHHVSPSISFKKLCLRCLINFDCCDRIVLLSSMISHPTKVSIFPKSLMVNIFDNDFITSSIASGLAMIPPSSTYNTKNAGGFFPFHAFTNKHGSALLETEQSLFNTSVIFFHHCLAA